MSTVVKDLGAVSAYAYAVEKGYTGTEAEFAELMADYAEVGQRAEDAADSALESKTAAQTAATTATNKATEATTAATTATNKAAEAQADADAAALDASQALSAASTATTKATEATTAAATATSAKTDAVAANTAAQSAKTAAQTAQTGAETAAASVEASAEQIATNAADISQLKSDLNNEITNRTSAVNAIKTNKVNQPVDRYGNVTNGSNGQFLRTKGDGSTEWAEKEAPTDEQVAEAVETWLDDHPEVTTTVQDGSLTEAKFSNALKLKAIKDYVTPEMYGAKGDGVTNDTEAFYVAVESSDCILLSGKYLIDFRNIQLQQKEITGINGRVQIIQNNSNVPFGTVGYYTVLQNLMFYCKQNTEVSPILVFGHYGGTFTRFERHFINNVNFDANEYTVPYSFNFDGNGGAGGCISNSRIRECYKGVEFNFAENSNATSWLTQHVMKNIVISHPVNSGFSITKAESRTQFSHCGFYDISVQLNVVGSKGFMLDANAVNAYFNLTTFLEGTAVNDANTYAIDFGTNSPALAWCNPTICGANLEGGLLNIINGSSYVTNGLNIISKDTSSKCIPKVEKLNYKYLIDKDFVSEYEYSSYFVSSILASVTKGRDDLNREVLTVVGGNSGGIIGFDAVAAINALQYTGDVTVYCIYESDNGDILPALARINGSSVASSNDINISDEVHQNRYISIVNATIPSNPTQVIYGAYVNASKTFKIHEIGILAGKQTCAKLF